MKGAFGRPNRSFKLVPRVRFTGCDGVPDVGQRLVKEHALAATIVVQSASGHAIELVEAHLRKGIQAPRRVVLTGRPFPDS